VLPLRSDPRSTEAQSSMSSLWLLPAQLLASLPGVDGTSLPPCESTVADNVRPDECSAPNLWNCSSDRTIVAGRSAGWIDKPLQLVLRFNLLPLAREQLLLFARTSSRCAEYVTTLRFRRRHRRRIALGGSPSGPSSSSLPQSRGMFCPDVETELGIVLCGVHTGITAAGSSFSSKARSSAISTEGA
jgi:hypothetical protein